MEQIQSNGIVIAAGDDYYLVKCPSNTSAKTVRVARKLSPVELNFGDEVFVKADYWKYKRAPSYVEKMGIRYKALSIQRLIRPETINNEEASVAVRFSNRSFLLQYGQDAVYCSPSVCYPGMEEDDIVRFSAVSFPNAPPNLGQNKCKLEVNYKCPNAKSLKFIRKPRTAEVVGFLGFTDGPYGFVQGVSMDGDRLSVFLHASVVQPQPCTVLNQMFSDRTPIKMWVIEQGANRRNDACAWRAILATDDLHRMTEERGVERINPSPITENPPANNSNLSSSNVSSSPSSIARKTNVEEQPRTKLIETRPDVQKKEATLPIRQLGKHVVAIPYDPLASPLEEANRQLRLLAHYLSEVPCQACLTAENRLK